MSNLKIIEELKEKYKAKGVINLTFDGSNVITEQRPFTVAEKDLGWDEFPIYDLMSGEEFLNDVDAGFFIDYDGTLAEVFIDGYLSNLGLNHQGIRQGRFLATKEFWENLMKTNKIEVNWANK
jgi:hypothetical protein